MMATLLACMAIIAAACAVQRRAPDVPVMTMAEASEKLKTRLKTDRARCTQVLRLRRGITMDSVAGIP